LPQLIIYTDLDGTLLDFETYSYQVVEDTVRKLNQQQIPLVFCSSKTRVEQEVYRNALHVFHPFITENGSAVFIPSQYFQENFKEVVQEYTLTHRDGYTVVELGVATTYIRQIIAEAREKTGCAVKGYADLSLERVCQITGLSQQAATLAATREYSETLLEGDFESPAFEDFQMHLKEKGLQCVSGGKFYTIMGLQSDKGKAIRLLNLFYSQKYEHIQTIGLGDSTNDIPLFEAVAQPFLVKKPGNYWQNIGNIAVQKVDAIGPEGWNQVVLKMLDAGY